HVPLLMSSCALPSQTSVPCDKPEITTNSENVLGFVSSSICLTNDVPNSGTPKVPVLQSICFSVTPRDFVLENICITSGSSSGIVVGSIPLKSCNILKTVGSSCPRISNFNKLSSIEWKSK